MNKNNPIFPFFSFALFGGALGVILKDGDFLTLKKAVTMISPILIIVGIIGYILTPPTMLDRAIDPTWYFIMVMQCGLFMALITLFIKLYDTKTEVSKGAKILLPVFTRFGTFSLTAFFFESVLSALLFKTVSLFIEIQLSMAAAILYGVFMVFVWNGLLTFIQKHHPTWSIEYLISKFVNHFTYSHKLKKVMKSDDFD